MSAAGKFEPCMPPMLCWEIVKGLSEHEKLRMLREVYYRDHALFELALCQISQDRRREGNGSMTGIVDGS
jgi:hypothetical protein